MAALTSASKHMEKNEVVSLHQMISKVVDLFGKGYISWVDIFTTTIFAKSWWYLLEGGWKLNWLRERQLCRWLIYKIKILPQIEVDIMKCAIILIKRIIAEKERDSVTKVKSSCKHEFVTHLLNCFCMLTHCTLYCIVRKLKDLDFRDWLMTR